MPSADDPKQLYEQLGIEPTATEAEIKKAYRKAALKWHPDKNPDDKETATENFQKVGSAYAVLSDPEKKERYDRTGSIGDDDEMEEPGMDEVMAMFEMMAASMMGGGRRGGGGGMGGGMPFDPFSMGMGMGMGGGVEFHMGGAGGMPGGLFFDDDLDDDEDEFADFLQHMFQEEMRGGGRGKKGKSEVPKGCRGKRRGGGKSRPTPSFSSSTR